MTTRFRQRVQNFNRSLKLLEDALAIRNPSDTERLGIIKSYEMCLELAWKGPKPAKHANRPDQNQLSYPTR